MCPRAARAARRSTTSTIRGRRLHALCALHTVHTVQRSMTSTTRGRWPRVRLVVSDRVPITVCTPTRAHPYRLHAPLNTCNTSPATPHLQHLQASFSGRGFLHAGQVIASAWGSVWWPGHYRLCLRDGLPRSPQRDLLLLLSIVLSDRMGDNTNAGLASNNAYGGAGYSGYG